jgi:hypothetical protein
MIERKALAQLHINVATMTIIQLKLIYIIDTQTNLVINTAVDCIL